MPLQRLSNSLSNDHSWVEIEVKMVEISRKPCKTHQHISRGHNFWFDRWIYNFFMFMETRHLDISRDTNISSIWVQKDLCTCVRIWTHIHTPRHTLKGFGSFPYMHVYVCLLLCLMFMLASLDLGFAMFYAPLWACSCVVTSIPLVAY